MARIAVLGDELVNKIAAGEVVERPASVVKELCENALDAGARAIRVRISDGGLARIAVSDDGCGMSREDAVLSLTRHATSKLRDLEGLFSIATMGFRGEAVPAIASVSRFTVTTAEPEAQVGTVLRLEGGGEPQVAEAAPIDGTEVLVEDLFFNTPARRKFMRRESTEGKHCEEAVLRLALAHPEVGFVFENDGRTVLSLPADEDLRERVAAALGAQAHAHLVPFEERRLGVEVSGLVAAPTFNLSNARGLYTFVNRRYVRDRGLNAAVQRAFRDQLPPGRQPVAVLFVELDPRAVDVNVHPQKLEVRFADGRSVYDAVLGGIRRALEPAAVAAPGSDFGTEASYASAVDRFLSQARGTTGNLLSLAQDAPSHDPERAPAFGQARPDVNHAPPPGYFAALRYLGPLGHRFWICEGRGATLVVLDPHAARERVAMTELRQAVLTGTQVDQRSLFTATAELSVAEATALSAALPAVAALGLEVEPFGGTTFALKAVPRGLLGADARALLADLSQVLPAGNDVAPALLGPALRVLACHAALTGPGEPSYEECSALFRRLDGCDFHLEARHPAVVLSELPFLELERRACQVPKN